MDVDRCAASWNDCWERYFIAARTTFDETLNLVFLIDDDLEAKRSHVERCFQRPVAAKNIDTREEIKRHFIATKRAFDKIRSELKQAESTLKYAIDEGLLMRS